MPCLDILSIFQESPVSLKMQKWLGLGWGMLPSSIIVGDNDLPSFASRIHWALCVDVSGDAKICVVEEEWSAGALQGEDLLPALRDAQCLRCC